MRVLALILLILLALATLSCSSIQAAPLPPTQCTSTAVAGGTGDALTIPLLPCTPTSTLVLLTFTASNATSTPTISVNGQTPHTILNYDGSPVAIGTLGANKRGILTYNGTNWFLLTPGVNNGYLTTSGLPPLHESQGGSTTLGQPLHIIGGDYIWVDSSDLSLATGIYITGTVTPGEQPGITWTVGSTPYTVKYVNQTGDNLLKVAQGLCANIQANSALMTALANVKSFDNVGYGPFQNACTSSAQVVSGLIALDQPYQGVANSIVGISTAGLTVTSCANGSAPPTCLSPRFDGGPFLVLTRRFPNGYTTQSGDLGSIMFFQDQINGTLRETGSFITHYYGSGSAALQVITMPSGGSTTGVGEFFSGFNMYCGNNAPCIPDQGSGSIGARNLFMTTNLAFGTGSGIDAYPTVGKDGSGNTQFQAQANKVLRFAAGAGAVELDVGSHIDMIGLATSSTGGGVSLCIDNNNHVYAKATCP